MGERMQRVCRYFFLGYFVDIPALVIGDPFADWFAHLKIARSFARAVEAVPFPVSVRFSSHHLSPRPDRFSIRMIFDGHAINDFRLFFRDGFFYHR
jgi:hypothetical protein